MTPTDRPADDHSPTLDVRSMIDYDADEQTITVMVGHKGFPGEVHLARARHRTLLHKIDEYIAAHGIAAYASACVAPGALRRSCAQSALACGATAGLGITWETLDDALSGAGASCGAPAGRHGRR